MNVPGKQQNRKFHTDTTYSHNKDKKEGVNSTDAGKKIKLK